MDTTLTNAVIKRAESLLFPVDPLIETLPDSVVVTDRSGTIVFANSRMEALSGYLRADLVGAHIEILIPEDMRVAHEAHRSALYANFSARPMASGRRISLRRRDGSLVPVGINLSQMEREDGEVLWVASVRDETDRAQVSDALKESEDRYRTLVDSIPVIVTTLSTSGIVTKVNRAWEDVTGCTVTDTVGKHFSELLHPEDIAVLASLLRNLANDDEPDQTAELRVMASSGEYRSVRATGARLVHNDVVEGTIWIARDVTSGKQAKAALQRSEERFRKVFEDSPLGMLITEIGGRVTEVNAAACRILSSDKAVIVGRHLSALIYFEDRDAKPLQTYSGPSRTEVRFRRGDQGLVVAAVTSSTVIDEDGTPLHNLHVFEDLTERKRLEAELAHHATLAWQILSRLTAREMEVLQLLTRGMTAPEVASELYLSARTVESHIASAYRKLNVHCRQEAVDRFDHLYQMLSSEIGVLQKLPSVQATLAGTEPTE